MPVVGAHRIEPIAELLSCSIELFVVGKAAVECITSCIDDLEAFRDQLGDTLLGAEAMARLAALAAKKGAQRQC